MRPEIDRRLKALRARAEAHDALSDQLRQERDDLIRDIAELAGEPAEAPRGQASPWVDMRGLAQYSGWGLGTVQKLSAADAIPGKVRHEGKVRFNTDVFDSWLLREHGVPGR
jgi:hypothetical protein